MLTCTASSLALSRPCAIVAVTVCANCVTTHHMTRLAVILCTVTACSDTVGDVEVTCRCWLAQQVHWRCHAHVRIVAVAACADCDSTSHHMTRLAVMLCTATACSDTVGDVDVTCDCWLTQASPLSRPCAPVAVGVCADCDNTSHDITCSDAVHCDGMQRYCGRCWCDV